MAKHDGETIIKKYANRRLYNTGTSTYVTLDDLAQMVKRGEDFKVQDAKSSEDITHAVLTQIIAVPFTLIAEAVTGGVTSFWAVVIVSVGKVITLTAATTYQAAVIALLYIDVRMRREALDVELTRAATADQPA